MRVSLWLLSLFAVAASVALFIGDNQSSVTLFWPPYRLDLSLNLVLLLLALLFVILHLAWRGLDAFFSIPGQARRWRVQHHERSLYAALLDALSHLLAGRYIRARKAANMVLAREEAMAEGEEVLVYSGRLRALAHLVAAESSQGLQDRSKRNEHLQQALALAPRRDVLEMLEGVQLRAAQWALQDRDPAAASQALDQLSQGAGRRTAALRLRLKAARMDRQTRLALETARLLTKHRAFSELASQGIRRALALELLALAYSPEQLQAAWLTLDVAERLMPEVAMAAARLLLQHDNQAELARNCLLPIWDQLAEPDSMTAAKPANELRLQLIELIESSFAGTSGLPDAAWLARIEQAQQRNPADALLQYLAGMLCIRLQLWGKAQQLLKQAQPRIKDGSLQRKIWRALAELAEQRGDTEAAAQAWRAAALV